MWDYIIPIAVLIYVVGMIWVYVGFFPLKGRKHSKFYKEYIKSPEWNGVRVNALRRAGYKCESCGVSNVVLQVHHLNYRNLGHESSEDLQVLCLKCHKYADKMRKQSHKRVYA